MKSVIDLNRLVLSTLSQMGVTLTNVDTKNDSGVFYVSLNKSKLIQSVEETLKSVYGILWTLVHGKLTDENRDKKIYLQYKIEGESDENS